MFNRQVADALAGNFVPLNESAECRPTAIFQPSSEVFIFTERQLLVSKFLSGKSTLSVPKKQILNSKIFGLKVEFVPLTKWLFINSFTIVFSLWMQKKAILVNISY